MTAVAPAGITHVATGETLRLRDATLNDNDALIELTAACTMHGDIALRMDRSPDFFALNRLEGNDARVGVVGVRSRSRRGRLVPASLRDPRDLARGRLCRDPARGE